ncbi:MAG: transposase domain-containing protein [Bacteroidetes bacterium]|jgi:hypothetical protein|nr:transposase domain-containing protein [Bacteroidota bacterium]
MLRNFPRVLLSLIASKTTFVLNFAVNFLLFILTKLDRFFVLTRGPNYWGNISINPVTWLKFVLDNIAQHPINRIDELLPGKWVMDLD